MWKKMVYKGKVITTNEINLKGCLTSGQSFNFKFLEDKNIFIGIIRDEVVLLKEEENTINFRFLTENSLKSNQLEFLGYYFQLEIDLETVIDKNRLKIKPALLEIIKKYKGLRILHQDIFECLISYICSANNNISRIVKMVENMRKLYGTLIYSDTEFGEFYSFPTFEQLLKVKEQELDKIGFGYRSGYICKTMKFLKENNGLEWLDKVKLMEDPSEELIKLPGVGKKVADCVCLCSCQKHDIVPIDVHMFKFYNENLKNFNESFPKINSISSKINYLKLRENYGKILGPYAGWIHSIFFINRIDKKEVYVVKGDENSLKKKRKEKPAEVKINKKKKV